MAVIVGKTDNTETLNGTGDSDTLVGGDGQNILFGGAGADTFAASARGYDNSSNTIMDFQQGVDKIDVSAYGISSFDQLQLILGSSSGDANDAYFNAYFGGINNYANFNNSLTVKGLGDTQLVAGDFIFSALGGRTIEGTRLRDRAFGTSGNDTIKAYDGDDQLFGGFGDDRLEGGDDDDFLAGGEGTNVLDGGDGDDTYYLTSAADTVVETNGTDLIKTTASWSLANYVLVEDLTLIGTANINGAGNELENTITGNDGANILDGGLGDDRLVGGLGNDTYVLGAEDDRVEDAAGFDTITSTISRSLADYSAIESLTLLGSASLSGTGNGLNNVITGNAGANLLDGLGGVDRLLGGGGNDIYVLGNSTDIVSDTSGVDTITSTISRSLTKYATVENLTLLGSADINGTGNAHANTIKGNAGDNVLSGGAGRDTLAGGLGNDTYALGSETDVVVDSGGIDTITSTISRSLAGFAAIEKLTFVGRGNINGTGNALANTIIGNAGSNLLNGASGNDTLFGGAGKDSFTFSTALSTLKNMDHIRDFVAKDDTIRLENAVFKKLPKVGVLSKLAFEANLTGVATHKETRIVYEKDTGELLYDADGSSEGAAAIQFADLDTRPSLTHLDFLVV